MIAVALALIAPTMPATRDIKLLGRTPSSPGGT